MAPKPSAFMMKGILPFSVFAIGCPNTFCPEYKAFMVNVSKA
jgi:hypothetical protein